ILFLLIGLQLRGIIETVRDGAFLQLVGEVALMSLIVIIVRILWVFPATYIPRWLFPSVRKHDPFPSWRSVTIVAWTGLRGGISLAAALALPLTTASGASFPERDLLIALTFGIILVTLAGQGLSLTPLIQFIHVPSDTTVEQERQRARLAASQAAQARLTELSGQEWVPENLLTHLQTRYEEKTHRLEGLLDGSTTDEVIDDGQARRRLHQEVVSAERGVVISLRDRGQIDDEILHDIERELDLEEQQLQ
nr:cation:proton antiporter [Ktedonobacteraceae bacterium]